MSIDNFVEKYTVELKDKFIKLEYYKNSQVAIEKKYIGDMLYYCNLYTIHDIKDLSVRDTYNDLKKFYDNMFEEERK